MSSLVVEILEKLKSLPVTERKKVQDALMLEYGLEHPEFALQSLRAIYGAPNHIAPPVEDAEISSALDKAEDSSKHLTIDEFLLRFDSSITEAPPLLKAS